MSNDVPEVEVEETTEYKNFVGETNESEVPEGPANLCDFLGIDEEDQVDPWKKQWVGMPEFEQEENKPFMKISMSFRNEEDYIEFAKMVEQNLTTKTKSIWYPKLDRSANTLLRWVEED